MIGYAKDKDMNIKKMQISDKTAVPVIGGHHRRSSMIGAVWPQ